MTPIKYIGYYNSNSNKEKRNSCVAAISKMDSICTAVNEAGYSVKIISPSTALDMKFYPGKTLALNERLQLKLFPSLPWGPTKLLKLLSLLFSRFTLFFYLLFAIKRGEQVIVYHSLGLINIITLLRKLKKFTLVLEVEEFYTDVKKCADRLKRKEHNFINSADRYIFPSELLNQKVNTTNKPHSIIYGTYQVEPDFGVTFNDDKIHVVYAGIIDSHKAGAFKAVEVAPFLSANYHLHIIGFGDIDGVKQRIGELKKISKCAITYDGLLQGQDYLEFLQKCQIGLSCQDPNGIYNETSFPSKVLSYMANGLRVVTVRIKVLELCEVAPLLSFYDEDRPESIAEAITNIDLESNYNSRDTVTKLSDEFLKKIRTLLNHN